MVSIDTAIGEAPEAPDEVPEPLSERLITLHMRRAEPEDMGWEDVNRNLDYGPASMHDPEHDKLNIHFQDSYWVGPADHPRIDELLASFPQVEIVVTEDKERVYIDAATGREYKSKRAYEVAQRAKQNKG